MLEKEDQFKYQLVCIDPQSLSENILSVDKPREDIFEKIVNWLQERSIFPGNP